MSLVLELQTEAIDGNAAVDQLLRKALAVAVKLKLKDFKTWITLELEGYKGDQLPDYRIMRGELVCHNPVRGLIPFLVDDPQLSDMLTKKYETGPVGVFQQMMQSWTDYSAYVVSHFPPAVVNELVKGQGYAPMIPYLRLNKHSYVHILDSVRNAVLKWSLKLEADGIRGDGMSFTPQEQTIAQKKAEELRPAINIINIETMINSSIQQSSLRSHQH